MFKKCLLFIQAAFILSEKKAATMDFGNETGKFFRKQSENVGQQSSLGNRYSLGKKT
jgi:hypothetical protein